MGVSTSGAQLAGKIDRFARDLSNPAVPLAATAMVGKRVFETSAAASGVLGSTMAGKRRAIGVRYDIGRASRKAGSAVAVITYTGPAHLVNNPTAPHFIGARRLGSRRRLRGMSGRVGATAAFGGSNRGAFGGLLAAQRVTRSGAVRSGGKQALTIGSDLRAYAFHPGTSGKGFYQRARGVAVKTLPQVYARKGLTEPLRKAFR